MQLQCSICEESESRANLSSHEWCPTELKRINSELVELQTQNSKQMTGKMRDSEANAKLKEQNNAKLAKKNK